jgi:hypothetical protein
MERAASKAEKEIAMKMKPTNSQYRYRESALGVKTK